MKLSELINQLALIDSTNEKVEVLRELMKQPNVKSLFYYAYSPTFTYGLKKVKKRKTDSTESLDGALYIEFLRILNELNNRNITGGAAIRTVESFLECLDPLEQQLCINVLNGDLRIGMNSSLINKACPNLIEVAPPYQRCSLESNSNYDKFPEKFFSQVKMDGMFINMNVSKNNVRMLTRAGNVFPIHKFVHQYESIMNYARKVNSSEWITGEVIIKRNGKLLPRKESNGICNSIMKSENVDFSDIEISFVIWDLIPDSEFVEKGKYKVNYLQRFADVGVFHDKLKALDVSWISVVETRIVTKSGALEHYKEVRRQGGEGTVVKDPFGFWIDGTSKDQVKMKAAVEIDMKIKRLNPGKGKRKDTFGSIGVESECGKVIGNVSGMTNKELKKIAENFDKYRDTILTVTCNELITNKKTETYNLFLPRWTDHRVDKLVADDLERIMEIFANVDK